MTRPVPATTAEHDAMRQAAQRMRSAGGDLQAAAATAGAACAVAGGALPGFKLGLEAIAACGVLAGVTSRLAALVNDQARELDETCRIFDEAEGRNVQELARPAPDQVRAGG